MKNNNYRDKFESFLLKTFIPAGFKITKNIELSSIAESSKYEALKFSIDNQDIVYRKAKITEDRPGAFLAIWKRPSLENISNNKPIPLGSNDLDYLFVEVEEHSTITSRKGLFIFPVPILLKKGIILGEKKGKTGFRVFPPWSQDRGIKGTKVFSESGKKTQSWQLPYYIEIDKDGLIDSLKLNKIFSIKITGDTID